MNTESRLWEDVEPTPGFEPGTFSLPILAVARADNSLPPEIGVNKQTSDAAGSQLSPDGLWYRDEGSWWSTLSPDRLWRRSRARPGQVLGLESLRPAWRRLDDR